MAEESSPTHDVFLSYSSKDKNWADAACSVLERHRVRCWIAPRDITPGEEWGAAIIKGINRSQILVLIFSGHANASAQIRREVERAISRGMSVLPVRIENVLPDGAMEYALGNRHWLDAFTPPMERQLELLARSVKTLLGNDDPAAAEVAEPTRLPFSERAKLWSRRNRTAARIAIAAGVIFICIPALMWALLLTGPRRPLEKGPERSVQTKPRGSPPSATDVTATDGFVPLFNGKDMTGWKTDRASRALLESRGRPS
jgi:TIR domain